MNTWYVLAIISLFLFGIQRFLYKVSAVEKCNTAWTTFSFMGTVAFIGAIFFFFGNNAISDPPLLIALSLINGLSFLTSTIMTIEALKYIPTSRAMPLIRLNTGVVVILSVILFHDRLSGFQIAGIGIAIGVIIMLAHHSAVNSDPKNMAARGFVMALIALASGSIAALSSKYAALHVNKLAFIALSYFLSMLLSLALRGFLRGPGVQANQGKALLLGFSMGIFNFAGFYSLLHALERGPLSVIMPVTGMYFVVVIALSVLFYKEKIDFSRCLAVILTVVSIILMRF